MQQSLQYFIDFITLTMQYIMSVHALAKSHVPMAWHAEFQESLLHREIYMTSVPGAVITGDVVTCGFVTGGVLIGGFVIGGVVTGGVLTGGITGGVLTGGAITGGVITGGVITDGVITGGVVGGGGVRMTFGGQVELLVLKVTSARCTQSEFGSMENSRTITG